MASELEEILWQQLCDSGLPWPQREVRFAPPRRWRFDFSWEPEKLAVEVQGGSWLPVSQHGRGSRFAGQCEKLSEAAILGWRILYCTGEQVRDGRALALILRAMQGEET